MEIIANSNRMKCEFGVCKNRADHAIKLDRTGIRSRMYICDKCLHELERAISAAASPPPRSVETAKPKRIAKAKEAK